MRRNRDGRGSAGDDCDLEGMGFVCIVYVCLVVGFSDGLCEISS